MRVWLSGTMLALALAACGPAQAPDAGDPQTAVQGTQGAPAAAASPPAAPAVALPSSLPAFVKPYPGATVSSAMTSASDYRSGGMLLMETPDPVDRVVAFYRPQFEGLADRSDQTTPELVQLAGRHSDGTTLMVIVSPPDTPGDATGITINWARDLR